MPGVRPSNDQPHQGSAWGWGAIGAFAAVGTFLAIATAGVAVPIWVAIAAVAGSAGLMGGGAAVRNFFKNRSVKKIDPNAPHQAGSTGNIASRSHKKASDVLSPKGSKSSSTQGASSPSSSRSASPRPPSSPDSDFLVRSSSPEIVVDINTSPLRAIKRGLPVQRYSELSLDRGYERDISETAKETSREVVLIIKNGEGSEARLDKHVHLEKINQPLPTWHRVNPESLILRREKTVLDFFDQGFLSIDNEGHPTELPNKQKAASLSSQEFFKELVAKWFPFREDFFFKVNLEKVVIDAKTGEYSATGTIFFQNPNVSPGEPGYKSDTYTLDVKLNLNTDEIKGTLKPHS